MKKFQFHLQKVIDMKEKNREQVEWSYANLLNDLQDEEKKLSGLFFDKQRIESLLSMEQQKGISIVEIQQIRDYLTYIELQIKLQKEMIEQTKKKLREKKEQLKEVRIEEKIWQNFREKKLQEYLLESDRNEQKEMDELATYRSYY
ncbi:flagellar export protein FliJ [Tepidibacillus fermentans]|uniref:Flagellar FliJ protein n=1 Tax=Tepidibacillus fermentans TaxID=1281767 RepID=A0A4R3KHM8_9BACI|nr:flagellar export protein FliJ [Tepidibacillus fermentans]TCS82939.1 flagellar FliJ protein [Tepidibacillus fermentans]